MEQKQGFRSGRGTADEIFKVKCIHQITDKMKKLSYTLFIDHIAEFNHLDRDLIHSLHIKYETDPADEITIHTNNNHAR